MSGYASVVEELMQMNLKRRGDLRRQRLSLMYASPSGPCGIALTKSQTCVVGCRREALRLCLRRPVATSVIFCSDPSRTR